MRLTRDIKALFRTLDEGLHVSLGQKLIGVYVTGAIVFPETTHIGDIDLHVLLTDPPTKEEIIGIKELHKLLARDFPPIGSELDIFYILLRDAKLSAPPIHQLRPDIRDNSWALHRAHMLAGRCIILNGPDPRETFPTPTWNELDLALQGELDYIKKVFEKYPAYCILNLCRIMCSYTFRNVVISKISSGAWAGEKFPRWKRLIAVARKTYAQAATAEEGLWMSKEAPAFFHFACDRIRCCQNGGHE